MLLFCVVLIFIRVKPPSLSPRSTASFRFSTIYLDSHSLTHSLSPPILLPHTAIHFVYSVNKISTYYRYYTTRALSTFKTYVKAWKNFRPAKSLVIHSSQMIKVFHVHSILSFYSISISSVRRTKNL